MWSLDRSYQWLCEAKHAGIFKYSICVCAPLNCTDVHPEMLEAVQTTSTHNLLCIFLNFPLLTTTGFRVFCVEEPFVLVLCKHSCVSVQAPCLLFDGLQQCRGVTEKREKKP